MPRSSKNTSDKARVVVLPRMDQHRLNVRIAPRSARSSGAIFMKFGPAPTTQASFLSDTDIFL